MFDNTTLLVKVKGYLYCSNFFLLMPNHFSLLIMMLAIHWML